MSTASRVSAVLLPFFIVCSPLRGSGPQPVAIACASREFNSHFLQQWVFRVATRTMMVLDLEPGVAHGTLLGTLSRPQYSQTHDFENFDHVQGPTRVDVVEAARCKADALLLTVRTAGEADPEIWALKLREDGRAEMRLDAPGTSLPALALVRVAGRATVSSDWEPGRTYSVDDGAPSNPQMKRIFDEDQAVRQDLQASMANAAAIAQADEGRRQQVRKLLADGALHNSDDFSEAAFVFQHSPHAEDYLLAHTLAMVAVRKGDADSLWIAAATLDRYLDSIGQPQIYGTQFHTPVGQPVTQQPYSRTVISDALRKQLGVPLLAEQEEQRRKYDLQMHRAK